MHRVHVHSHSLVFGVALFTVYVQHWHNNHNRIQSMLSNVGILLHMPCMHAIDQVVLQLRRCHRPISVLQPGSMHMVSKQAENLNSRHGPRHMEWTVYVDYLDTTRVSGF